jgi:hypothetical protein
VIIAKVHVSEGGSVPEAAFPAVDTDKGDETHTQHRTPRVRTPAVRRANDSLEALVKLRSLGLFLFGLLPC